MQNVNEIRATGHRELCKRVRTIKPRDAITTLVPALEGQTCKGDGGLQYMLVAAGVRLPVDPVVDADAHREVDHREREHDNEQEAHGDLRQGEACEKMRKHGVQTTVQQHFRCLTPQCESVSSFA